MKKSVARTEPASRYRVQIIDTLTGDVAQGWRPGDKVEADLIAELVSRLGKADVGLFTRQATVVETVAEQLRQVIFDLKARV